MRLVTRTLKIMKLSSKLCLWAH